MPHNPYFGHVSGSGMTPMHMMGMNGMGMGMGMAGGMNPYMQMGMQGHGGPPQSPGMSGQSIVPPPSSGSSGGQAVKPFDPSLLKSGRAGHYGYLQGRGTSRRAGFTRVSDGSVLRDKLIGTELAGPPPGTLPAGISADEYAASKYGSVLGSAAMGAGASQPPSPSAYGPPQTAYGNGSMGMPMKTGNQRYAGELSIWSLHHGFRRIMGRGIGMRGGDGFCRFATLLRFLLTWIRMTTVRQKGREK
jgi:hypothetical protein